jgi:hypothetical protein
MGRKTRCLVVGMPWLIAAICLGQESALPEPKTKLEQFQAKVDSVLITNSTKVGTLEGKLGASIAVEAKEITDPSDDSKITGLAITVQDQRRGGHQSTSYIDLGEIDSLLKAIDTIGQLTNSAAEQVDYRTKGDFAISRITSERLGGLIIAVRSGSNPSVKANFDVNDLPKLKELITKAQSAFQSSKEQAD